MNAPNKKGLLVVISGPAGSGKGTVIAKLLEDGGSSFSLSVSATTRAPRPGEADGVNYHYITRGEFEGRIAKGEMLEHTEYCGNYYGTPLREAIEVLESGRNLILEVEVEGALNVKRLYPDAVLIMLLPPSFAVQEHRLRTRGTETEEKIALRLARTREELPKLPQYDYVVYNYDGGADICADSIRSIVLAETCSTARHTADADRYFEAN